MVLAPRILENNQTCLHFQGVAIPISLISNWCGLRYQKRYNLFYLSKHFNLTLKIKTKLTNV